MVWILLADSFVKCIHLSKAAAHAPTFGKGAQKFLQLRHAQMSSLDSKPGASTGGQTVCILYEHFAYVAPYTGDAIEIVFHNVTHPIQCLCLYQLVQYLKIDKCFMQFPCAQNSRECDVYMLLQDTYTCSFTRQIYKTKPGTLICCFELWCPLRCLNQFQTSKSWRQRIETRNVPSSEPLQVRHTCLGNNLTLYTLCVYLTTWVYNHFCSFLNLLHEIQYMTASSWLISTVLWVQVAHGCLQAFIVLALRGHRA